MKTQIMSENSPGGESNLYDEDHMFLAVPVSSHSFSKSVRFRDAACPRLQDVARIRKNDICDYDERRGCMLRQKA